jgi:hypothetical protein
MTLHTAKYNISSESWRESNTTYKNKVRIKKTREYCYVPNYSIFRERKIESEREGEREWVCERERERERE